MKRTALQRKTPLTRTKPMRRKPARRIARKTAEDRAYTAWLHTQSCAANHAEGLPGHTACSGPIQAAHFRDHTGMGLKAPADQQLPLCQSVHEDYDRHHGRFRDWTLEAMKAWFRRQLERVRTQYREERR